MAQFEFKLPDIGEGVVEGEIVKWLVKAGDAIVEDQPLVEVMTDKATVTIPSPRRGKVVRTVGAEGDVAKVHGTLVVLELDGAAPAPEAHGHPAAPAPAATVAAGANGHPNVHDDSADGRRVLATPVTRRMARELGVDLAGVEGTGPQGRVMKKDLLAAAEGGQPAPAPEQSERRISSHEPVREPFASPPKAPAATRPAPAPVPALPPPLDSDEVRPLRGLRKSIARQMVQSHSHVVPFTFVEECETAALTQLRSAINAQLAKAGQAKLSYLPFITKALLRGFARYPELNSVMDEEKQALVVKKDVNVGFGAATDAGLTVFVVKDVAHKSVRAIGAELERLSKAAREGKLHLAELKGGTFTVTSLGKDGGLLATPVVNHPEVAILGVHRIKEYPRVVRGADGKPEIEIGEQMNLSCSFDHRVIDGHIGAAFLYEVIRALEAPESMLID